MTDRPDCWSCQHFAVSWDPKMPYLCKRLGFKSKMVPYLEVVSADGRACMGYERRPHPQVATSEPSPIKKRNGRLVNIRV